MQLNITITTRLFGLRQLSDVVSADVFTLVDFSLFLLQLRLQTVVDCRHSCCMLPSSGVPSAFLPLRVAVFTVR